MNDKVTMKDYIEVIFETLYETRVMSVLGLGITVCVVFGHNIVGFMG